MGGMRGFNCPGIVVPVPSLSFSYKHEKDFLLSTIAPKVTAVRQASGSLTMVPRIWGSSKYARHACVFFEKYDSRSGSIFPIRLTTDISSFELT